MGRRKEKKQEPNKRCEKTGYVKEKSREDNSRKGIRKAALKM